MLDKKHFEKALKNLIKDRDKFDAAIQVVISVLEDIENGSKLEKSTKK